MATITGLTAERMREIEAASIVDGTINSEGHLVLTRYDGREIDAGSALVAIPDERVVTYLPLESVTEVTPPNSYPDGISLFWMAGDSNASSWPTFAGKWGTIETINWNSAYSPADTIQTWSYLGNPSVIPEKWFRTGNGDGWSPWRKVATTDYVDAKANPIGIKAPFDPLSAYPRGLSMMAMAGESGPDWSSIPNTKYGTIVTANDSGFRAFQLMQVEDGYLHFRRYREDSGGWRPWTKVLTEQRLSAVDFNQGRGLAAYPWGLSYLYLNSSESAAGGWDFAGKFGMVTTFRYSDDFIVQTWQKHQGGSSGETEVWQRTANGPSGWSKWRVVVSDSYTQGPVYAIQLSAASLTSGSIVAGVFGATPLSPPNGYTRSTNRITVPGPGTYSLSYRYKFNGSVGAPRAFVEFTVAATSQYMYTIPADTVTFARGPVGEGEDYGTLAATVALNSGAQVGMNAFQNSGAVRSLDGVFHIQRTA